MLLHTLIWRVHQETFWRVFNIYREVLTLVTRTSIYYNDKSHRHHSRSIRLDLIPLTTTKLLLLLLFYHHFQVGTFYSKLQSRSLFVLCNCMTFIRVSFSQDEIAWEMERVCMKVVASSIRLSRVVFVNERLWRRRLEKPEAYYVIVEEWGESRVVVGYLSGWWWKSEVHITPYLEEVRVVGWGSSRVDKNKMMDWMSPEVSYQVNLNVSRVILNWYR